MFLLLITCLRLLSERQQYGWGKRPNYYSCEIAMRSLLLSLRRALFLGASASVLLHSTSAIAANRIVLKYGLLRNAIPVSELSTLAETGTASQSLQAYLNKANQNPQDVRRTLTQPVKLNPLLLERVLNSPVGELILDQISQVIRTPSGTADQQALRSALVLSATKDGEITLIETIQHYPSSDVEIDTEHLVNAYSQLQRLRDSVQALQNVWEIWR
jgi:Alpha/beta hydrolase of unknown function (DUF1400)